MAPFRHFVYVVNVGALLRIRVYAQLHQFTELKRGYKQVTNGLRTGYEQVTNRLQFKRVTNRLQTGYERIKNK